MRFGLVHRIMTDALATLGILAVVSTAGMGAWTDAVLLVGLSAALVLPEKWQTKPSVRHLAPVGSVLLALYAAGRLLSGHPVLDVAVEFAALIQVLRLATRRGAAHDQQVIVLALLHLVAGTVLGGGLAYGLCFFGFIVVAPGALVLSHLRREVEGNYRQGARDRTGLPVDVPRILRSRRVVGRGFLGATCLISVPIFLFTALLFVLFPRVGLSLLLLNHPRSGRLVGFSDRVDLGEVGVLRSDPSIALRFEVPDAPDPPPARLTLRLRGTAFDGYDGRSWSRSQNDRRPADHGFLSSDVYPLLRTPDLARDRRVLVDVEPIDPPVVFLPPHAVALEVRPQSQTILGEPLTLQKGPEGELRYSGEGTRGLRYTVFLAREKETFSETLTPSERTRYLQIPSNLPKRIAERAHEWGDGQLTDLAKAKALEEKLRTLYQYDVASPSGGTKQPLDHFLFESRRGHCEFFSSSMAIMLRQLGIPSRNVTGFVGGTYNRFGRYYAVREGDAHSWVEAYFDDPTHPGWSSFDPTPPAGAQPLEETTGAFVYVRDFIEALSQRWNRYIVGYDLRTQVHLFEDLHRHYERIRHSAGMDRGMLGKITRGPVIAGVLLGASLVVYSMWKRRRANPKPVKPGGSKTRGEKRLETAAALYRALDAALAERGLLRPRATPPLRHAESLCSKGHPLGDEVLALTCVYLALRFGGTSLDSETQRDFQRRVRKIRSHPPETPPLPVLRTESGSTKC